MVLPISLKDLFTENPTTAQAYIMIYRVYPSPQNYPLEAYMTLLTWNHKHEEEMQNLKVKPRAETRIFLSKKSRTGNEPWHLT